MRDHLRRMWSYLCGRRGASVANLSASSDFVRLVHLRHWDTVEGRFRSSIFQRSNKKLDPKQGVSIVSTKCILEAGRTVCEHLRYFYPTVGSDPVVFLCLDETTISSELDATPSVIRFDGEVRKDDCHRNMLGWSAGQCRSFIKPLSNSPENFVVCSPTGERSLTLDDIEEWMQLNPSA